MPAPNFLRAFENVLRHTHTAGELSSDRDADALARFFVNPLHGLRVTSRAGADREALEDTIRIAFSVLA